MLLGSTVAHDPTMDLDDLSTSGSAKLSDGVGGAELSVGQCVAVQLQGVYTFSGSAYLASVGTVVDVIRTCEFYAEPDCGGVGMALQGFRSRLTSDGS